jgi:hypothetical protein
MILVTGASGNAGGAVMNELRKSGAPFRGMYRSHEDAAKAPAGVATVIADFSSAESMKNALIGIDSVYLVCSPIPELVDLESNAIDACRQSGVKHVLLSSSLGAADYPKSFPAWHRRVDPRICARPVHFVNIPEAAQRNAMLAMGMPEWQVDALLDLQRYYTNGQGGEVTGVLTQLLGRPPVKVDSFLEEFKDSFRTAVTYA